MSSLEKSICCFVLQARRIIAMLSQDFIFDGCTILVHGFSRVVLEILKTAAQNKKLFRVFCTGFVSEHPIIYLSVWHHIENYFLEKYLRNCLILFQKTF